MLAAAASIRPILAHNDRLMAILLGPGVAREEESMVLRLNACMFTENRLTTQITRLSAVRYHVINPAPNRSHKGGTIARDVHTVGIRIRIRSTRS